MNASNKQDTQQAPSTKAECGYLYGILWLREIVNLIWDFYLSVAACHTVWGDPFLRYALRVAGTLSIQQTTPPIAHVCP